MEIALVWLLIIAFIIIMYILLDGFTLGIGLLLPWIKDEHHRDLIISTVLPVWDGNETWLVFAGASLYGAFPLAFSTLFPAWYLPLMVLVIGLLLRGISFEFRLKAGTRTKLWWDLSLLVGSFMAISAQGMVISSFVTGFSSNPITHQIIAKPVSIWFSIFCIVSLLIAYSCLGSARLIKKTSEQLQNIFYNISSKLQWLLIISVIFVGVYSPNGYALKFSYITNLYQHPSMILLLIIMIFAFVTHIVSIKFKIEKMPFISLIIVFVIAYLTLIINFLPYIVPNQITFMQAKSDDSALFFMLVAAAVLIPMLLLYTAFAYRIFGGKTNEKIHY